MRTEEAGLTCADSWCDAPRAREPGGRLRRHCAAHDQQRRRVLLAIRTPRERQDLGNPKSRQAAHARLIVLGDALPADAGFAYHPLSDAIGAIEGLIADLEDEPLAPRSLADIWEDARLAVDTIQGWTADLFSGDEGAGDAGL